MSNINWTQRDGQIDIESLRNFSYYPIVRDIIETVKDLLGGFDWTLQLKAKDENESGASIRERSKNNPDLAALRRFFKKPDGVQTFRSWLRGLYDDMLVIDAASVWKQRDTTGKICSLIQIDGGQVFPLIDESGLQPAAGDAASKLAKYLVQTSGKKPSEQWMRLKKNADAMRTGGSPAFQLTPYGFPAQQLTANELTYALYNRLSYRRYGFSKVEICLAYIALGLGRLDFQASFYRSGNMPEGIAFLPPDVPVGRVEELNKYLDTILSGQMRNRRRIIFLPSYGAEKQPNLIFPKVNEQVLKDEFDDMIVRYLCHNFGLDPSSFIRQPARLSGENTSAPQAQKNEAIKPCLQWAKDLLDGIIQDDLGYTEVEAKWVEDTDLDEVKQSGLCVNELSNGIRTLDEAREARGLPTIGEEWSQVPIVKIATGYVRVDGKPMPGEILRQEQQSMIRVGPDQPDGG
jgi:hypothetical protein